MTDYYAVKKADCTSEQIEQIYNLAQVSVDADSSGYTPYEPNRWEFIVFEEYKEIFQCLKEHFNKVRIELITPEEAIQRLFAAYLEN